MYISIQLKIPIMIKLFLVIQWKRTGKYLDNGNRMTKYPFAVIIIPKRDKEQRQMNYEESIAKPVKNAMEKPVAIRFRDRVQRESEIRQFATMISGKKSV